MGLYANIRYHCSSLKFKSFTMKFASKSLFIAAVLQLSACANILNNLPGVYRPDIEQGNIINQDMIDQLRPKMTQRQVLYIMGSPMLVDAFHQTRWDYIYSEQPGGEPRRQKRISLFFNEDELIGVQGDIRPSTLPVPMPSYDETLELPKRQFDKTLWGKINSIFSSDPVVQPDNIDNSNSDTVLPVTPSDAESSKSDSPEQSTSTQPIDTNLAVIPLAEPPALTEEELKSMPPEE
jgi:outer membrane protein assembly factor BamE